MKAIQVGYYTVHYDNGRTQLIYAAGEEDARRVFNNRFMGMATISRVDPPKKK